MGHFLLIAAIIFGIAHIIIQDWLARAWKHPEPSDKKDKKEAFSVIIAARNEEQKLGRCLESIINQLYDDYEIILVLDRCTDQSLEIARKFSKDFSNLRIHSIKECPREWAPKKWALNEGINLSKNEWLVFTDADCIASPQWLLWINFHIKSDKDLILGIGEYEKAKGFLNTYIRFETFYTYFLYICLAARGYPYMGVGRNLAYRKSFYLKNGGFEKFKESLSGDDDLLINHFAQKERIALMTEKDSRTLSIPKDSWSSWMKQKFRHLSASNYYNLRSKIILGAIHTTHLFFYFSILGSLLILEDTLWSIGIFAGKISLGYFSFRRIRQDFRQIGRFYLYPLLDVLLFIYNLTVVPVGLIKRPEWK